MLISSLFCRHRTLFYIGSFDNIQWFLGIHRIYKYSYKEYICPECNKRIKSKFLCPIQYKP